MEITWEESNILEQLREREGLTEEEFDPEEWIDLVRDLIAS